MTRARLVPWLMLAIWASWLVALQGWLVARTSLGTWAPDLSIVLLVACAARLPERDVITAAFLLALARIAYSIEPPSAVLAGFFTLAAFVRAVRGAVEVNGALLRACASGFVAWSFASWLVLVHEVRDAALPSGAAISAGFESSGSFLPLAVSTGLCALVLGPALIRLPGLSPLVKRRW